MRLQRTSRWILAGALVLAATTIRSAPRLLAQQTPQGISVQAMAQINALAAEKNARTPVQRKIDSNLLWGAKMASGEAIARNVQTLDVYLPDQTADGIAVDVRAAVSQDLLDEMVRLGAHIMDVSARYENIRLRIAITQIEAIAGLPRVRHIMPKQEAMLQRIVMPSPSPSPTAVLSGIDRVHALKARKNRDRAKLIASVQTALSQDGPTTYTGSVTSQGDSKHNAALARSTFGVSGAGVKVGVLSDGVTNLAASQGTGDLGTVTVLPGQTGSGDEGTAMLEIIHDLAPNAQLYFATAFTSLASFAQNIRDLRTAGCDIIVDDVLYYVETPFQDGQTVTSPNNGGIVIQAVRDVNALGAMYFSSALNFGNKDDGTSGTWEGDFVDGGAASSPITGTGSVHDFGSGPFDAITATSGGSPISLHWADPLGASGNDYDLFLLNGSGTSVLAASTNVQDGNDDPFELMSGSGAAIGTRIVIVKRTGAADRFMHLDTNFARLSISTSGSTHGHAATGASFTFGVAATSAQVNGLNPFNGAHSVETFSSDGFRHLFFTGDGTPFTPGNFSSTGGATLAKPDFTAADGVSISGAGGFATPFYGTSAAAPHAAAIAALVKSKNLSLTNQQIRNALFMSAIDIEAPGYDRDSGVGIIMADTAVAAVPAVTLHPDGDFDGDSRSDIAVYRSSAGQWFVLKSSTSYTSYSAYNWGLSTDIPVPGDYDGDFQVDLAIYRPSTGQWFILKSSTGYTSYSAYTFGLSSDIPVQRDFDGDGKTDIAVYRPATGQWFILKSSTGFASYVAYTWGVSTDVPVPGDYDGDGKADLAIYRPSTGQWFILKSFGGYASYSAYTFGVSSDIPVPGDYDGDFKSDIAIFRPSTGQWFILRSASGFASYFVHTWGVSTDVPVPGDYDGDKKYDLAVFRPSAGAWFILKSSSGYTTSSAYTFGLSTDTPIDKRP